MLYSGNYAIKYSKMLVAFTYPIKHCKGDAGEIYFLNILYLCLALDMTRYTIYLIFLSMKSLMYVTYFSLLTK